MFWKWLFYISVVLALILVIENIAYNSGYGLLFISASPVSSIVITAIFIWFWAWFWLKTFLISWKDGFNDDEY